MGKLVRKIIGVICNGFIARDDKESEQAMEKSTLEFIRNLKLIVRKLHVRFEDDILMPEKPYALGLVINVITYHFHY